MQVELLSSLLWRGAVNPGGTVLDLPSETAERLIEAGVAKSAKAPAKAVKAEAKPEPKKKAPRKKAPKKKSNTDE
jgi:hypothetical protein